MVAEPQARWARWICGQRADRQLTIRIPRRTGWQRMRMEGWRWTIFSSIWVKHCVTWKRRWSGSSSSWPIPRWAPWSTRVDTERIFVQQGHPDTGLGCRRRGWRCREAGWLWEDEPHEEVLGNACRNCRGEWRLQHQSQNCWAVDTSKSWDVQPRLNEYVGRMKEKVNDIYRTKIAEFLDLLTKCLDMCAETVGRKDEYEKFYEQFVSCWKILEFMRAASSERRVLNCLGSSPQSLVMNRSAWRSS